MSLTATLLLWNIFIIPKDIDTTINAVQKGFFIAPLITLIMANQEKVNKTFMRVFNLKDNDGDSDNEEKIELDPYSMKIRTTLMELILLKDTFSDKDKEIWNLFRTASNQAITYRESFERLNHKTLVLSSFWLLFGYVFFIFGFYSVASFFLFFAILMIINRLLLGVRSIIKYYLIYKVASLLRINKRKVESENINSYFEQLDSNINEIM